MRPGNRQRAASREQRSSGPGAGAAPMSGRMQATAGRRRKSRAMNLMFAMIWLKTLGQRIEKVLAKLTCAAVMVAIAAGGSARLPPRRAPSAPLARQCRRRALSAPSRTHSTTLLVSQGWATRRQRALPKAFARQELKEGNADSDYWAEVVGGARLVAGGDLVQELLSLGDGGLHVADGACDRGVRAARSDEDTGGDRRRGSVHGPPSSCQARALRAAAAARQRREPSAGLAERCRQSACERALCMVDANCSAISVKPSNSAWT